MSPADRGPAGFADRYGPWAVVTGAGQGIGAAFVAELVERGVSVLAVDRDGEAVTALADELRRPGVEVRGHVCDLAVPGAATVVARAVDQLDVNLLISNAALSFEAPLVEQDVDASLTQLRVNCEVPLVLVHHVLPRFLAQGRGGIILLSSLSAMRGAPLVAGYAATKAWNMILAESLWEEVRDQGVDVMALLPGSTRTPGWLGSRPQTSLGTSNVMEPADVAGEALDTLGTAPSLIAGQANRESEAFMASLDRGEAVRIMGDVMRTMYPPVREPDPTI